MISQPAFQRLRRIRQLGWTDYIYPGATHTRFEHSLGVMHTATLLYDAIKSNSGEILRNELACDEAGLSRDRQLVRFAALLHDVGHGPFSHASEDLLPAREGAASYVHEDYSVAIIKGPLREAIEKHPLNANCGFRADDIASLIEGSAGAGRAIFWRDLISGQMDADRMDYLLRDSHHVGVQYGRFDLHRLVGTIRAIRREEGRPRLGIGEGGAHAAEALVMARYLMFTQVYFHKTRVAYDVHVRGALRELLPGGKFPPPTEQGLQGFLGWDDWKVLGLLAAGSGGEHGRRLAARDHYRLVFHTPEAATEADFKLLGRVQEALGDLVVARESASKSWYKTGATDIPVIGDDGESVKPLSKYSNVVAGLKPNSQVLLYARREDRSRCREIVREVEEDARSH